jgi:alpha-ketoglutarate-dependent taurine dioxygenase
VERSTDSIETVLANLSEIDKWELRRLLREEGILVRFKENQVEETD